MLFNSYEFIFLFLPISLLAFYLIGSKSRKLSLACLTLLSLFFYAWWNPVYLLLILVSIFINLTVAKLITKNTGRKSAKAALIFGIVVNLGLLSYFKYTNFAIDQLNTLFGLDIHIEKILLPLAISFFTFQQIAYLVDTFKQKITSHDLLSYSLFICFFPQLIAGPIVHHKEMLPQFKSPDLFIPKYTNFAIGLTLFSVGLFKKVVLADGIAPYSTSLFNAVEHHHFVLSGFEGWIAAISYSLQLYFDFSGYSDMALGIAMFFGIRLPENFNSPYKSASIVEFWRRWHMTLSRFLRDYVYIALGGNRHGKLRRYINLLVTMVLGGIWHGAGWTFMLWGLLHGMFLIINHGWNHFVSQRISSLKSPKLHYFYWLITMLAVVVSWVYFRAESLSTANSILLSMLDVATFTQIHSNHIHSFWAVLWCLTLIPIVLFLPNSTQVSQQVETLITKPQKQHGMRVNISLYAIFIALLFVCAVGKISQLSEFLYFNF